MKLLSSTCRLSLAVLSLVALHLSPVHGSQSAQDLGAAVPSQEESAALVALTDPKDPTPSDIDYELYRRIQDYNNNIGKRAYSYVSEYKRLPVYNFGLGKRSQSQLYGFGLGKRSQGGRTYSFGLGKRSDDYDEDEDDFNPEENEEDVEGRDEESQYENEMVEKRNRLYSFGLGKRVKPYSFGLGKRYAGDNQRLYSFGLGKRSRPALYGFGLGKRGDGRLYSFGLGKRPNPNQNSRFNFGLGKRSGQGEITDALVEEAKRPMADHRFSFGLGKREITANDMENANESTSVPKNRTRDHKISKRSLKYGFGLGKRSRFDNIEGDDEQNENQDDLSRYARRPYSFGLGKRIPMYDFGIGKRSDV